MYLPNQIVRSISKWARTFNSFNRISCADVYCVTMLSCTMSAVDVVPSYIVRCFVITAITSHLLELAISYLPPLHAPSTLLLLTTLQFYTEHGMAAGLVLMKNSYVLFMYSTTNVRVVLSESWPSEQGHRLQILGINIYCLRPLHFEKIIEPSSLSYIVFISSSKLEKKIFTLCWT